jgi:hypothetical protein
MDRTNTQVAGRQDVANAQVAGRENVQSQKDTAAGQRNSSTLATRKEIADIVARAKSGSASDDDFKAAKDVFDKANSEVTTRIASGDTSSPEFMDALKQRNAAKTALTDISKAKTSAPTSASNKPTGTPIDAVTGAGNADGSQANPIVVKSQGDIDTAAPGTFLMVNGQLMQK